jgi:hypothetical protein
VQVSLIICPDATDDVKPAVKQFLLRTIRAVRLLARDQRIPKPLRWVAAIGLLPIPGPVDEAVLVVIAPIFLAFYRGPMREAWAAASQET